MTGPLVRFDLSLPNYFSYAPAPEVRTRAMIPRKEPKGLYIRGEFGQKSDGQQRPITAHNTTHLDVPYHFNEDGADLAGVLNSNETPADRPCLARVLHLAGDPSLPGAYHRDGVDYCEAVGVEHLPPVEELRRYEALVILTGFGAVMRQYADTNYTHDEDGFYHVPHLTDDAAALILEAGLAMVAIDSTTVERQTSSVPHRMSGDVHVALLTHEPPVLIVEGLDGTDFREKLGEPPHEAVLQMVPRRANAAGAEASHSRAFLYFYREDPEGDALRRLLEVMTPGEFHG